MLKGRDLGELKLLLAMDTGVVHLQFGKPHPSAVTSISQGWAHANSSFSSYELHGHLYAL